MTILTSLIPAQLDSANDDGVQPARQAGGGEGQVSRGRGLLGRRRARQRQCRRRVAEDGTGGKEGRNCRRGILATSENNLVTF